MHRRECVECEKPFVALRSDKLTCGATCRKRYERRCRKITETAKANDAKARERFERLCDEANNAEG